MLNRFNELPYRNAIIIVTASFVSLILIMLCMLNLFSRRTRDAVDENEVIKFEYCAQEPKELCVLSFGRDGSGDAIINLYVPDKKFPDFYLIIKKADGEKRYGCIWDSEVKTSVFCNGAPLSLKQTIEIDIHASSNDKLLATGRFLLQAFLVSTPNTASTAETPVEEATVEVEATETSTPFSPAYPYP